MGTSRRWAGPTPSSWSSPSATAPPSPAWCRWPGGCARGPPSSSWPTRATWPAPGRFLPAKHGGWRPCWAAPTSRPRPPSDTEPRSFSPPPCARPGATDGARKTTTRRKKKELVPPHGDAASPAGPNASSPASSPWPGSAPSPAATWLRSEGAGPLRPHATPPTPSPERKTPRGAAPLREEGWGLTPLREVLALSERYWPFKRVAPPLALPL